MLKYLFLLIGIVCFVACNSSTTTEVKTDSLINTNAGDLMLKTTFNTDKLKGVYSGSFDGTPISISINYISGKNISGYNVHKGLKRNMRGSLEPFGSQFKILLDEPGNNKFDGHFELFIDTSSFTGKGSWTPKNNANLKKKDFTLAKKKEETYNGLITLWSDTLSRTIQLKVDGSTLFSYYSGKGTPQEQMQNISGNWQEKGDSLIIFWQNNSVFSSRRSSFFIVKEKYDNDSTTYITGLKGEKMDWYNGGM